MSSISGWTSFFYFLLAVALGLCFTLISFEYQFYQDDKNSDGSKKKFNLNLLWITAFGVALPLLVAFITGLVLLFSQPSESTGFAAGLTIYIFVFIAFFLSLVLLLLNVFSRKKWDTIGWLIAVLTIILFLSLVVSTIGVIRGPKTTSFASLPSREEIIKEADKKGSFETKIKEKKGKIILPSENQNTPANEALDREVKYLEKEKEAKERYDTLAVDPKTRKETNNNLNDAKRDYINAVINSEKARREYVTLQLGADEVLS